MAILHGNWIRLTVASSQYNTLSLPDEHGSGSDEILGRELFLVNNDAN